ncbi:DUF3429 domain-containing protein [Skermanella mucosa]|uniref:DUF3429 domain-containing protein n=1 Tax=Skermanella mucosa TaxID=1789672 RepID=UPI00192BD5A8|nr:DUF3429 domain-containing protein [Skermanella mucosa]UEM21151.1 DUF3429 domain-containing protein [Skermanella mucosa]
MLSDTPRPALALGFAGLIPFYLGAVAVWLAPLPWNVHALQVQVLYAATILSFLGAVHWGLALANWGGDPPSPGNPAPAMTWTRLGWSVVPPLVAWIAVALTAVPALVTFIVAFAGMYLGDRAAVRSGHAPAWYLPMRGVLTVLVILALALSLARVLLGLAPGPAAG